MVRLRREAFGFSNLTHSCSKRVQFLSRGHSKKISASAVEKVEREYAVVYSRDFGKDPIWVSIVEQPTLGQTVRQKLSEGKKVTCLLLGVILKESSPEELQKQATVKSSVLDVLLEITKFCDLYLMERVIDDERSESNKLADLLSRFDMFSGNFGFWMRALRDEVCNPDL
ncbi:hypothetical protein REPUB_Repub12eG0035300 [Reevesia pubescens]